MRCLYFLGRQLEHFIELQRRNIFQAGRRSLSRKSDMLFKQFALMKIAAASTAPEN